MASPKVSGMGGHFDERSLIRRVHRERIVALSGPRALLMQAAHPLAFEGFFATTKALDDPYARLRRTAEVIDAIVFGERAEADRQTLRVRRIHRRVKGRLASAAGAFPAGTRWRADDPELLLWVLASLADSGRASYERHVGSLTRQERDSYWSNFREVGAMFGLEPAQMPECSEAFESYMSEMINGGTLEVTPAAKELAIEIVLRPPVPLALVPALQLANAVTVGTLPTTLRRMYGLSWDPLRGLALAAGGQYCKRVLMPLTPAFVRRRPASAEPS